MSVKFLARGNNGNLLIDFKLTTDNYESYGLPTATRRHSDWSF